jgi:SNF2 family DNA or RNA helicase
MPLTQYKYHDCYVPSFRAVNGIVSDRISKMIDAGNISGAIEALGGKHTDNIVELVKKNKLIELEAIRSKINIWTLRGDEEKKTEWTNREKVVTNHIEELDKRFSEVLDDNCTICFSKLDKPVMEPSCQNIFCGGCILTWLNTKGTCPLCRKAINRSELVYIDKDKQYVKPVEEQKNKTKEQTIIHLIQENKDGRFIVFSDWDESFNAIREVLKANKIDFVEIKGSITTRTKKIEKFRNGEVNVVFLNSKTDSSGINMQETTDIILYHAMNEGTTKQIIGRANRIGRKIPLKVHHLVSV